MFGQSCNRCSKFKVKNANYCWNCGVEFVSSRTSSRAFETALPTVNDIQPIDQPIRVSSMLNDNWQVLIARSGLAFAASGAGLWFFGFQTPFGYATIPAALIAMGPPMIQALADFRAAAPPKPEMVEAETIRIEHVEETLDGPKITIAEMPDRLKFSDIKATAKLVTPMPYGKGERFSRRKCRMVKLSESKYYLLQDFFLTEGYAEYPGGIKTNGLQFTSKGKKLLVKALAYTPSPSSF